MALPNKPFLINYNAKNYNPATHTIPKEQGQTFDQDMVLNAAASSYTNDHITVNGQYYEHYFNSTSENPFSRSGSQPLTIIAKTSNGVDTDGTHAICSSRGSSGGVNWMIMNPCRNSPLGVVYMHNSNNTYNNCPYIQMSDITIPNIYSILVSNGIGYGKNYTSNTTFRSISNSYGSLSSGFGIFTDTYASGGFEIWNGDFYWLYISTEALTDDEIQQVINYNEGVSEFTIEPDVVNFSYSGGNSAITITSENNWSASTTNGWITVSPSSGTSAVNSTTVIVSSNLFTDRNGTVTFNDGENVKELTVSQSGYNISPFNNMFRNGIRIN